MNDEVLQMFRKLAEAMADGPTDWQWIGPHASTRMFGITRERAFDYAARFGGEARQMVAVTAEVGARVDRVLVPDGEAAADFILTTAEKHESALHDGSSFGPRRDK